MSGQGSQYRQTLQLLPPPDLELWLLMVHPPCWPKLALLSSANSPRAQEMRPLMTSSQVQVRRVQVAQRVKWHYQRNRTTHAIHACANSSFQQPVHSHGERVWCQHAPLAYSNLNREPSTLRMGMCTDWHNTVVRKKELYFIISQWYNQAYIITLAYYSAVLCCAISTHFVNTDFHFKPKNKSHFLKLKKNWYWQIIQYRKIQN